MLVFEDADLERALDAALFTIFSLNGERCTAGSRIFVQESVYPQFVAEFAARARRLIVGDPQDPEDPGRLDDHPGPLRQGHRLHPHRPRGRRHPGGRRPGASGSAAGAPEQGQFIQPTVFADVDNRMRIAQGGDLRPGGLPDPVQGRSRGAAPGQRREYGLASYIWTQDIGKAHRLARGIEAGMVFINSQNGVTCASRSAG